MEAIFHLCEERKKTTTKKKCEAKVTHQDWIRKKCNSSFIDENKRKLRHTWIACGKCDDKYNFKCIPKTHIEAFGLDEDDMDEVSFFCHKCAMLSSDDDSN